MSFNTNDIVEHSYSELLESKDFVTIHNDACDMHIKLNANC